MIGKLVAAPSVLYAIWGSMAFHKLVTIPAIPEGKRFSDMWFFEGMVATHVILVLAGFFASAYAVLSIANKPK